MSFTCPLPDLFLSGQKCNDRFPGARQTKKTYTVLLPGGRIMKMSPGHVIKKLVTVRAIPITTTTFIMHLTSCQEQCKAPCHLIPALKLPSKISIIIYVWNMRKPRLREAKESDPACMATEWPRRMPTPTCQTLSRFLFFPWGHVVSFCYDLWCSLHVHTFAEVLNDANRRHSSSWSLMEITGC